jgi:hypothetical protein
MKKIFTPLLLLFSVCTLQAQLDCTNALICDDFDSYVPGALGPQADHWSTWSGDEGGSEDGLVSTTLAFSGANSLEISGQGGPQDVLLLLGDQTTGNWRLEFKMYVYDGQRAYWNLQKCQDDPGGCWGQEVTFTEDGTGSLDAGGEDVAQFTYPHDQWFDVVQFIDLDNDRSSLFIDGKPVYSWPSSVSSQGTSAPLLQVGAIDFYATNQGSHLFFIDDVRFMQLPANTAASRMVQLTVDLTNEGGAAAEGVFVAGEFNGWSTTATPMENRTGNYWQAFVPMPDATDLTYKFVNGSDWEIVPEECGANDGSGNINRNIFVDTSDVAADTICFSECVTCDQISSVSSEKLQASVSISPNPAAGLAWVKFELNEPASLNLKLVNLMGQTVFEKQIPHGLEGKEMLDFQGLTPGIYFVQLRDGRRQLSKKLIVE